MKNWLLGFVAGSVLASYLTLSCATSHGQTVPDLIDHAAAAYGLPAWRMHRIARCESGYFPGAVNPHSGASGVYQFLGSTWRAAAPAAGFAGASVFDAVANVYTAAHWMAQGYWHWWVCR
jgi:soluble lytic murein transglycosylase-like protein